MVTVSSVRAALFRIETEVLAPVFARDTLPLKLLPVLVRAIDAFVAVTEASTATIAVLAAWVMLPVAEIVSKPVVTFTAPRASALLLFRVTAPLLLISETVELNELALARVMSPPLELKVAALAVVIFVPVACVMSPVETIVIGPVTLTFPRARAPVYVTATALFPVLARARLPAKAFVAEPRVIAPLVAVKEASPVVTIAVLAAWVVAPTEVTNSGALTLTSPRTRALLLRSVVLPAPELVSATAPVKALLFARLIVPPPEKAEVTPAVITVFVAWVMFPVEVTESGPATFTDPRARLPV